MSDIKMAKPTDQTPPQIPQKLTITPFHKDSLVISWNLVTLDTLGRSEDVKGYHIYRYSSYDTATNNKIQDKKYYIGYVPEPKKIKSGLVVVFPSVTDSDELLLSIFIYSFVF